MIASLPFLLHAGLWLLLCSLLALAARLLAGAGGPRPADPPAATGADSAGESPRGALAALAATASLPLLIWIWGPDTGLDAAPPMLVPGAALLVLALLLAHLGRLRKSGR